MKVLVFGGTTEGRQIISWLAAHEQCQVMACCATEYGGSLVDEAPNVAVSAVRLNQEGMEALIRAEGFQVVVDATHPYAVDVTANAKNAALACNALYVRLLREETEDGSWTEVETIEDAAGLVAQMEGNVLLATGSKDLRTFVAAMPDFQERLFARILPVESSLTQARDLGISPSHIIAVQGPFSEALNMALIDHTGAKVMVTKASGSTGGFWEKVSAAEKCGITLVVIRRPEQEEGYSFDNACERLQQLLDEELDEIFDEEQEM